MDRGAWRATDHGVAKSQHDLAHKQVEDSGPTRLVTYIDGEVINKEVLFLATKFVVICYGGKRKLIHYPI